jgi:cysteinyl-tRNA synthetase
MELQLFNTETKLKELFTPIADKEVKMYHCGPTVYWTQHIGNMRAVVMADVIVRTLKYLGYNVTLVRNYTDVGHLSGDNDGNADSGEDRMEKGAKREGLSPVQIAEKYIDVYEKDIADLNVLQADIKPKATEHIQEMIAMVQILLDKGYAYSTDLAVYFDTSKAQDYHKLSRQKIEENQHGAGTGDVSDANKKHPADFALWFFKAGVHKNALQYWSSPFTSPLVQHGEGFPGWHIECSAMSKKYLGDTLDIHMGGIEHISIHHTNEIAQSEAANGARFVNYWLHNEHLLVNGGKMSKSEGTSYSLSDIKEKGFDPLALRYFFLQSHYRSKQNFTWDALQAAQKGLRSLYTQTKMLGDEIGGVHEDYRAKFQGAVADDFNTPKALAVVSELLKSDLTNPEKLGTLLDFDTVLGLRIKEGARHTLVVGVMYSEDIALKDGSVVYVRHEKDVPQEVLDAAQQRAHARFDKDFETSDSLRDKITTMGYEVLDTDGGQLIKKK